MIRLRRLAARVQVAPFELAIALLLVLSGIRFLWKEDELEASQIGQTLPWPQLWAACYLVSGAFVLVGVLKPSSRVEAAGLALMASVVTINAIAFSATYDVWADWQFGVAVVFYASLMIAALARLRVLLKGGLFVVSEAKPELVISASEQDDGR